MRTLTNFNFKNKRVLVRCDFDVALDERGRLAEDFRIKQSLPTIKYLLKKGAKLILIGHLGRPQGFKNAKTRIKKFSLRPIAKRLEELLKRKILFLNDCIGKETENRAKKIKVGDIILLENLRFHKEEEENNTNFAKRLAKLGDIYINEAFSNSHRHHASMVGIVKYLPAGAGFLLAKEIKILTRVLKNPARPFIVIIGGAKIETKTALIEQFLKRADHLLLGGEVANAILIGKGLSLGQSLLDGREIAQKVKKIDITNPKIHLPVDGIIAPRERRDHYLRESAIGTIKQEEKIFDLGPETVKIFSEIIKTAKMILWSGPLGLAEEKKFAKGTKEVAQAIVKNKSAFKIIGGGDTIAAINKLGLLSKFDHVSTGGGAMLEFLSGEELPGIEALK